TAMLQSTKPPGGRATSKPELGATADAAIALAPSNQRSLQMQTRPLRHDRPCESRNGRGRTERRPERYSPNGLSSMKAVRLASLACRGGQGYPRSRTPALDGERQGHRGTRRHA